jgi:hypothetical protein
VAFVGTDVSEECIASFRVDKNHSLLVTANVSNSPILVTLMMQAIRSSESSVLIKDTRRYIREDGILHSHRRGNLKSEIVL